MFWFQSLGYEAVFWRLRLCQLGLFTAATSVVFVYGWCNLRVLGRHVDLLGTAAHPPSSLIARLSGPQPAASRNLKALLEVFAPLAAAMVVGFGFAQEWDELIRFLWAQPFGEAEPLYGHDIAFYLFALPFLDLVQGMVAFLAFAGTVTLAVVYARSGLLTWQPGRGIVAPRSVLRHLAANAALFLAAWLRASCSTATIC